MLNCVLLSSQGIMHTLNRLLCRNNGLITWMHMHCNWFARKQSANKQIDRTLPTGCCLEVKRWSVTDRSRCQSIIHSWSQEAIFCTQDRLAIREDWDRLLQTNPLEFRTTNFTYPHTLCHYTLFGRAMSLEYLRRDIPWLASSCHHSVSVSRSYCFVSHLLSHYDNAPHLLFISLLKSFSLLYYT
jgi:hypothetical protein